MKRKPHEIGNPTSYLMNYQKKRKRKLKNQPKLVEWECKCEHELHTGNRKSFFLKLRQIDLNAMMKPKLFAQKSKFNPKNILRETQLIRPGYT